jgi:DNA repair exonuclease SbcCD ATPase subunit
MNRNALITAVLGILVLGLALDDMRLRSRTGELQEQLEAARTELDQRVEDGAGKAGKSAKAGRSGPGKMAKARPRRVTEDGEPAPSTLGGPGALSRGATDEDIEARRAERQAQFRAELDAYVEAFGAEHQLSEAVLAEVEQQVLSTMEEVSDLWAQTRAGEADRAEVRERMDELGVELELDLAERLGAADAEAFVADLPGPLGANRPSAPAGR